MAHVRVSFAANQTIKANFVLKTAHVVNAKLLVERVSILEMLHLFMVWIQIVQNVNLSMWMAIDTGAAFSTLSLAFVN